MAIRRYVEMSDAIRHKTKAFLMLSHINSYFWNESISRTLKMNASIQCLPYLSLLISLDIVSSYYICVVCYIPASFHFHFILYLIYGW